MSAKITKIRRWNILRSQIRNQGILLFLLRKIR